MVAISTVRAPWDLAESLFSASDSTLTDKLAGNVKRLHISVAIHNACQVRGAISADAATIADADVDQFPHEVIGLRGGGRRIPLRDEGNQRVHLLVPTMLAQKTLPAHKSVESVSCNALLCLLVDVVGQMLLEVPAGAGDAADLAVLVDVLEDLVDAIVREVGEGGHFWGFRWWGF